MKVAHCGATPTERFAGSCKFAAAAAMVSWLIVGAFAPPARADESVLPDDVYDAIFLVHLGIVAQDNCTTLKVSQAASDAAMTRATQRARAETGLSYPDIAAVYETSEFDHEMGSRIDRFLKKYPGDDICSALSQERAVDRELGKIVRLKND